MNAHSGKPLGRPMDRRFAWTDERIARLRELAALKWSGRMIAAEFGITRNMVIGKAARSGIKMQGHEHAANHREDAFKRRADANDRRRQAMQAKDLRQRINRKIEAIAVIRTEAVAAVIPANNPGKPIDIFALTNFTCRWPIGDGPYLYCGAVDADLVAGNPYCACHAKLAFVAPLPKKGRSYVAR